MTRYVIGPDVTIRLAHDQAVIGDEHQMQSVTGEILERLEFRSVRKPAEAARRRNVTIIPALGGLEAVRRW